MTRIIGGLAGSRKLVSPAKVTRPTSDRIRESIFNSLESKGLIENKDVLDLYAGTGALALEALSRGARSAILVESNKQAAGVCIKNARLIQEALAEENHPVVAKVQIKTVRNFLASTDQSFDLVFVDPPYETSNTEIEQDLLLLRSHLSGSALVILERSSRTETINAENYQIEDEKNFGDTDIYWLRAS